MGALLALSRGIDAVNETVGKAVAWLILVSVLVSATNAIVRKLFNISSNAWLELQWYLFGAAFLGAAAYTLRQNEHIRIDILYGSVSRKVQHWIDLLGHIFFLMPFVILMLFKLTPFVMISIRSGELSTNSGGLILWPAKLLFLIAFWQLFAQGVSEIVRKIAMMRGLIEDPHAESAGHHGHDAIAQEEAL